MTFTPSKYQQTIFDWIRDGSGNAIVNAVAGSGKTTTLVNAAGLLPAGVSSVFLAFNKHIVNELSGRLANTGMVAQTLHSMGNRAVASVVKPNLDDRKYNKISKELVSKLGGIADRYTMETKIKKYCEMGRLNLADFDNEQEMRAIGYRYGIIEDSDSDKTIGQYFALTRMAINHGNRQAKAGIIDFTDMVYLPVLWNLSLSQSDWVFLDECQDLSPVQRALMMKAVGDRALAVGDPSQSIMGFAGAATDSFQAVKAALNAQELPLSVCYRCPTSHISLAAHYVPHIEAAPTAATGEISYAHPDKLSELVKPGDLILCRRTAPLIANCIKLIKNGIAARVRGRDVSKTLTDLAKQAMKAAPTLQTLKPGFPDAVRHFEMTEQARAQVYQSSTPDMRDFLKYLNAYKSDLVDLFLRDDNSEERIANLTDRCDALAACYERYRSATIEDLCSNIEALFADDSANPPIWLSSIHRAKGLEADRVFIIDYDKIPMRWKNIREDEKRQEDNLVYVALTRAKKSLMLLVADPALWAPKPKVEIKPVAVRQLALIPTDIEPIVVTAEMMRAARVADRLANVRKPSQSVAVIELPAPKLDSITEFKLRVARLNKQSLNYFGDLMRLSSQYLGGAV